MVSPVFSTFQKDNNTSMPDQASLFNFGYMGIRDHIDDLWKVLSHHRTRGINHVTAVSAAVLVFLGAIAASDHTLGWLGGSGVGILMLVAVTSLLMSWHKVRNWIAGLPDPYLSPGDPPGQGIRADYIEYRPEITKALSDQRANMIEAIAYIEKWQKHLKLPYGILIGAGATLCALDLTPIC